MKFPYGGEVSNWVRDEPKTIDDFVGRQVVWDIFYAIGKGTFTIDLGCGEGYFSRKMATVAKRVIGIDLSEKMLSLAIRREIETPQGIEYCKGDVKNLPINGSSSVDICVGNFVIDYIKPEDFPSFYQEIARVLRESGHFILLMSHPTFTLDRDYKTLRYDRLGYDYIKSKGKYFPGTIRTVDDKTLEIGLYHSTFQDHFDGIHSANLIVERLIEPRVPVELGQRYPIFQDLVGKTPSLVIVGRR